MNKYILQYQGQKISYYVTQYGTLFCVRPLLAVREGSYKYNIYPERYIRKELTVRLNTSGPHGVIVTGLNGFDQIFADKPNEELRSKLMSLKIVQGDLPYADDIREENPDKLFCKEQKSPDISYSKDGVLQCNQNIKVKHLGKGETYVTVTVINDRVFINGRTIYHYMCDYKKMAIFKGVPNIGSGDFWRKVRSPYNSILIKYGSNRYGNTYQTWVDLPTFEEYEDCALDKSIFRQTIKQLKDPVFVKTIPCTTLAVELPLKETLNKDCSNPDISKVLEITTKLEHDISALRAAYNKLKSENAIMKQQLQRLQILYYNR